MKLDWVVNEETYGPLSEGSIVAGGLGGFPLTYPSVVKNLPIGLLAATNRLGSAWPDGERQFVKAVRGEITLRTSSWVAGDTCHWMFRIVKKPIDLTVLGAIIDGNYSLSDSEFANERFVWQRTVFDTFIAGTTTMSKLTVMASVNQWLEPDEALFLMVENVTNSSYPSNQRLDMGMKLRTLMKADQ